MAAIDIFKALASDHRLQIMHYLKDPAAYFVHETDVDMTEHGVCVEEIQRVLGLTQSTTSHYLTMMSKAGLVTPTRLGKWTYYRRNGAAIQELSKFIDKEI
ncbi:helix-turn-helix domain-containing protein [Carnobacterium sp. PL12RED10]|uniref:ArsR/SmtB family transcription factor n=1 Tax=Carnobacterium sp. PL12RED10 TaxID=2592351 RepID=UPI0011F038A0|nr:metalloregulator ArsR/SmtB family transcription factor [Carnobacterium sp. PL12RED10]KAF3299145.1 helix-turn-helix domain-containing protein [Carnobacterium sp. PL12RED10]